MIAAWARSKALGRLSMSWMPAASVIDLWKATDHFDSKNPLGLESLAPR